MPGSEHLLADGLRLGCRPGWEPQVLRPGRAPHVESPFFILQIDNCSIGARDAVHDLKEPGTDLLLLQRGAQDLPGLVEGEQGSQGTLNLLLGSLAVGYVLHRADE